MGHAKIEMRIFSPRWGREDMYELDFTADTLEIRHGPRMARCLWRENLDPEWEGDVLVDALENDSVYPPSVLPRLIEHAWREWRGSELTDSALQDELAAVADWLNVISKAKPASKFWTAYF